MPTERCQDNNRPGWRWGKKGKCYTYQPGSSSAETKARKKAEAQGMAIGEYFAEMLERMRNLKKQKHSKDCGCGEVHQEFEYRKYPPCHPNCKCEIAGGTWYLSTESESGPCEYCTEKSREFNGGRIVKLSEKPR